MKIPIDKGYMPDYIAFGMPEGGLVKCQNLLPYEESYSSVPAQTAWSTALSGTVSAGTEFRASDKNYYQFVGTSTKLYRIETDGTPTDVTRAAGAYTTSDNTWSFCQTGDWVIATNYNDVVQVLKDMIAGANFVALGGTPPQAKYCLINNNHLIMAYTYESATAYPQRLRWSAYGSYEDWTESITTGADYEDLSDAMGDITGIASVGSRFLIFHKDSISLGWYVGAPQTFNFAANKWKNVGAFPGSMVSVGNVVYFLHDSGAYTCDGETLTPIGTGWAKTMIDSVNPGYHYRITTAKDAAQPVIYWSIATTASTSGSQDIIYAYNYKSGRVTTIDTDVECIFNIHYGATYMDDLDSLYADIDDIPYLMDSNVWLANSVVLGSVNTTDAKVSTFTGAAMTGVIETGDICDENMLMIRSVTPKIYSATTTPALRIGYRLQESDTVSYTTSENLGTGGRFLVRATGKLMRLELTTGTHLGIAPWIEADVVKVGRR